MLTIILSQQVLNKACPIICKVTICTEFCQFGKKKPSGLTMIIVLVLVPVNFPMETFLQILGKPLRAKYYGTLENTSISHYRKYCAVIG